MKLSALFTTLLLSIGFTFTCTSAIAQGNAKDLFYEELKEQHNETFGAAYCIELRRAGQPAFLCNNRYSFQSGDSIRLHVKPNANRYAYILLTQGTSGKKDVVLYPPSPTDDNLIMAGKEVVIPPKGMLTFDSTVGAEEICLILTPQKVSDQRLIAASGVRINSDVLSGTPQNISGYKVYSNDGAYSYNSTKSGAPGSGQVFVVNPRGATEPTAIKIVLNHGASSTSPPPMPQPEPTPTPTPQVKPPSQKPPTGGGANSAITDKWAFIVGVNKFRAGSNLQFCVPDALLFKDFLVKECGFAPNHVLCLTDENATTRNINHVMTKLLPQGVQKDDLVLLYFSSHGTPDKAGGNYIVTHDFDGVQNNGIHMQTLGELIKQNIPSNRVVTILDTCFSGNARDLDAAGFIDDQLLGSGQIIVSSCSVNESSLEDPKIQHGLFTFYLTKALREKKALKASFDACRDHVTKAAAAMNGSQNPIVKYDRWQGNDVVLYAKPTKPR